MATYYIDPVNGNDANSGLSYAQRWKTIAKALGAAGISSGDSVYLKGGAVFRETVTVAMVSPIAETRVLGDVDGVAFAAAGDPSPTTGIPHWTTYTTNDTTAPAAAACCNLSGRDFLTFQDIQMVGGNASTGGCIRADTLTSQNIKLTRCPMIGGAAVALVRVACAADTALTWTIDSCPMFAPSGISIRIDPVTSAVADYDMAVTVKNCVLVGLGASGVSVQSTGASAFGGGGVRVDSCSIMAGTGVLTAGTTGTTSGKQVLVYNSVVFGSSNSLSGAAANQIVEDHNVLYGARNANVAAGANTLGGTPPYAVAPLFDIGQAMLSGKVPRTFLSPQSSSPWLGRGAQAGGPTVDLFGTPRPAGGSSPLYAAGAIERANTWAQETGTVLSGAAALSITGPGIQDFEVPVDAAATTVSIYLRYDSTYVGTKPQLKVVNGSECGVVDASATMVAAADTWEKLSLTFTPTRQGIVTLRLQSNDTNGAGKAFADDFAMA